MWRYLAGLFLGFALVPVALYGAAVTLPTPTVEAARWVSECLSAKAGMVRRATKPQLLILAGSNALYGFSSALIATAYHIPSTNLGTHAGLGRKYILDYGLKLAGKGDLVVLPLEYALYGPERYDNALSLQVLVSDRPYFEALPLKERLKLVANVTLAEWAAFVRNRISPDKRRASGCQVEQLNAYGDETGHGKAGRTPAMLARLKQMKPGLHIVDDEAENDLRAFRDALKSKGAQLVLTYPNLLATVFDANLNAAFLERVKALSVATGVALAGAPAERVFSLDEAYDTEYHVTDEGQIRATHILMRQLNAAGIPLPRAVVPRKRLTSP